LDDVHKLLFVCSGNINRSPMAEVMADTVAMQHAVEIEARSAGTLQLVDRPCPRPLIAVAREVGLDLSRHRSQGLTAELLDWADHVVVMEPAHAEWILTTFPDRDDRITQLGPLIGRSHIDDPHGSWFKGPYRRMRDDVRKGLERFVASALAR
jgi:protein-tyrosine-phosphatase